MYFSIFLCGCKQPNLSTFIFGCKCKHKSDNFANFAQKFFRKSVRGFPMVNEI